MTVCLDALILGAGPAGATAALNLAPMKKVWLIDAGDLSAADERIGESLAPAACRLLTDMRLLDSFAAQGHSLWRGSRSVWGSSTPTETDSLRNPDGPGWHLDRRRFDSWLRAMAVERGAELIWPVRLRCAEANSRGWSVELVRQDGRNVTIRARTLIDATGRPAVIARRLGSRRESSEPRMVCAWLRGRAEHECGATRGFNSIEAVEDGWWYTAPLPGGQRVLAFHTDSDLPARRLLGSAGSFIEYARRAPLLAQTLNECGFRATAARVRWTAASGGMLWPPAGPGWFAAGDAAVHFDPLSSQGLLNALFTGLACAEVTDRLLDAAEARVTEEYGNLIRGIRDAYVSHWVAWYREEGRWPGSLFWARRH